MSAEIAAAAGSPIGVTAMKIAMDTKKTEQLTIANDMAKGVAQIQAQAQKAPVAGSAGAVDVSV